MEISHQRTTEKCYAISEEKFIELEPILLPETSSSKEFYTKISKFREKELKISGKFNRFYSESDWQKWVF